MSGTQISMPIVSSARPLGIFRRSFSCKLPDVWASMPQELMAKCQATRVAKWHNLPSMLKQFKKRNLNMPIVGNNSFQQMELAD